RLRELWSRDRSSRQSTPLVLTRPPTAFENKRHLLEAVPIPLGTLAGDLNLPAGPALLIISGREPVWVMDLSAPSDSAWAVIRVVATSTTTSEHIGRVK